MKSGLFLMNFSWTLTPIADGGDDFLAWLGSRDSAKPGCRETKLG
jgi:hypothetical protein